MKQIASKCTEIRKRENNRCENEQQIGITLEGERINIQICVDRDSRRNDPESDPTAVANETNIVQPMSKQCVREKKIRKFQFKTGTTMLRMK